MDFKVGETVFIWTENGKGVYDGIPVVIVAIEAGYCQVKAADGAPRGGTMPAYNLLRPVDYLKAIRRKDERDYFEQFASYDLDDF